MKSAQFRYRINRLSSLKINSFHLFESLEELSSQGSHLGDGSKYEVNVHPIVYVNFEDKIFLRWKQCNTYKFI